MTSFITNARTKNEMFMHNSWSPLCLYKPPDATPSKHMLSGSFTTEQPPDATPSKPLLSGSSNAFVHYEIRHPQNQQANYHQCEVIPSQAVRRTRNREFACTSTCHEQEQNRLEVELIPACCIKGAIVIPTVESTGPSQARDRSKINHKFGNRPIFPRAQGTSRSSRSQDTKRAKIRGSPLNYRNRS
jgi:hypothetical protein